MKQLIWVVYDLGIDGDYDGLYSWLDLHEARECGDSSALLNFRFNGDILTALKKEIKKHAKLRMKDRIYVIFKNRTGKSVGKFLYGRRRKPAWYGYAGILSGEDTGYDET
jgi:hypothetical protein